MKTSKQVAYGLALAMVVLGSSVLPSPGRCGNCGTDDNGWVSLFNGKDLAGWITPKKEHNWKVIDGVIDYEAKGGNLVTEREFEDYVLKLEWRFKRTTGKYNARIFNPDGTGKVDKNGRAVMQAIDNADSGIFLRGTGKTQANLWCWPCGSGQLWSYHTSRNPELRRQALPLCRADRPVGEWNEMEITMRGTKVDIVLNGRKVIDADMEGAPTKGPIALQHHGGFNEKTRKWSPASALIQFRNIRIKELPKKACCGACAATDLLAAGNLDDFTFFFGKDKRENNGAFALVDGILSCAGDPRGWMATKKKYSNYTLEADLAFVRPDGLKSDAEFRGNSGILIHCVEGKGIGVWPRSIEVQGMYRDMGLILPIPRDLKCKRTDDREARAKVLKPVGEWNTLKVVVDGGEMTIFLNGTVVSTVSDCELTEGPIGFQSEGVSTRWRNIRIR